MMPPHCDVSEVTLDPGDPDQLNNGSTGGNRAEREVTMCRVHPPPATVAVVT